MPNYQVGEHKIDHPPLFACREHKQFLRFNARFIEELVGFAQDRVPGNLSEIAAPMVGGRADAFKLPDYLIPPRVLVWNPENYKGPLGLPFTLIFIDKRFVGIPAVYLTYERFEGCEECTANPPPPEPARAVYPDIAPAPAPSMTGSAARRGPSPAPQGAPARPSGPTPTPVPAGARSGTGRFPAPGGGGPGPTGSNPGLRPPGAPPQKSGTPGQPVRAPGSGPVKPGTPASPPPGGKPRPRPPEP